MTDNERYPTHGETTTRLKAQGAVANCRTADQLFYVVGQDTLLHVPAEDMCTFTNEMRQLEALVEIQQQKAADLSAAQAQYIEYRQANFFSPEGRTTIHSAGGVGNISALESQIHQRQQALDNANNTLSDITKSLSSLSENTNHITELIPIQRIGSRASTMGFKMTYVRSQKIKNHWRRYKLRSKADTTGGGESILTNEQVDWKKLHQQLTDIHEGTSIKMDIPWFDDWIKLDDQEKELFRWSEAINKHSKETASTRMGNDHGVGGKVNLEAEAQLMRWAYGASGLSGEVNPFKRKATIKADAKTELNLAEAKGTMDLQTPPGGYIMAYPVRHHNGTTTLLDFGLLRGHLVLSLGGAIGASLAAELSIDAELGAEGGRAQGIPGSAQRQGMPGSQRINLSVPDGEAGTGLAAFVGGQLGCTVAGQVEWLSPETKEYAPFAKIAPGIAAQAGAGAEATFKISYSGGKFRIMAKAALCFGAGAKGKVSLEVDAGHIAEFAKWVYYQLKNANFSMLDFMDQEAYEALSDMVYLAISTGEDISHFISLELEGLRRMVNRVVGYLSSKTAEGKAMVHEIFERIKSGRFWLSYASPDTKGALLSWIQNSDFDKSSQIVAVNSVMRWVQSTGELDSLRSRVTSMPGDYNPAGYVQLAQEHSEIIGMVASRLASTASRGFAVAQNDTQEYVEQVTTGDSSDFYRPCNNETSCMALV